MKKTIQIKSVFGSILFELEKKNNSVKDTLIEAVKKGIDLRYADLRDAYLRGANLKFANLRGADLSDADLGDANLEGVNLEGANLRDANLGYANLRDADLGYANLRGADLRGADLGYANLRDANLVYANLGYANLRYANLGYANLRYANLRDVNLEGADLRDVNLEGVNLEGAKNIPFIPTYLPEGEFVAWKKLENGLIVKLKILEDSKRSRATGDKCRCDKALVLEFQNSDGSKSDLKTFTNKNYSECAYTVGEVVKADSWDENRWNVCSNGIHFFLDRESAVNY